MALKFVATLLLLAFLISPAAAAVRCLWMPPAHGCCGSGDQPTIAPAPRTCCQVSAPGSTPAMATTPQPREYLAPHVVIVRTIENSHVTTARSVAGHRTDSRPSLSALCTLLI